MLTQTIALKTVVSCFGDKKKKRPSAGSDWRRLLHSMKSNSGADDVLCIRVKMMNTEKVRGTER